MNKVGGPGSMNNVSSRGSLSVDQVTALFEERLRVNLPGGTYKVIQQSYSGASVSMWDDRRLAYSMVIRLQPEGHILPLNPAPVMESEDFLRWTGKGSRTN